MQQILFIGGGNMATALIGGILQNNNNVQISVLEISANAQNLLQQKFSNIKIFGSVAEMSENFDVIFLAVKPQNLADALQIFASQKLWQDVFANALIISIVAGIPTQKIQNFLNAKNLKIVRVMPNTPALINQAMSGIFANEFVSENNKKFAETLLSSVGKILWLENERQIDAITAISGSGPAYVFLFLEALQKAAENLGFTKNQAEILAMQTLLGSALLAKNSDDDFATLRQKVTSKGGTTAAALEIFFKNNFGNLVENACKAAEQRSIELGK